MLDQNTKLLLLKYLAYVFGRRQDTVFLQLQALLEPFGITRYYTDGWGPTSGTSMPTSIRWARTTPRKLRANTLIFGPGSSGWCAARSVSPRRTTCTIWSLGCSSIAMNLGEPYETGSTPLQHLPHLHVLNGDVILLRNIGKELPHPLLYL